MATTESVQGIIMGRNLWKVTVVIVAVVFTVASFTGCKSLVQIVRIIVPPTIPSAPVNLTVGEVAQNSVSLQWTDLSDDEDGFRIYRDGTLIGTAITNVVTYLDDGLKPATEYQYIVKAYNQVGESEGSLYRVRTLNPPITVNLDRVGVYDNGEIAFRDFDGGEVYVYIVISDGKTTVEGRIPLQEDRYLFLEDNEVIEIGHNIFSTSEVGDFLTIAVVGYERDGGEFEQLVYTALGAAIESAATGGAGGLLEAFDYGLGGLIAQFFGAEDEWLGSYENTWDSDSNWGTGRYTDIACENQNGTLGLRLWFTIENPMEPLVSTETSVDTRVFLKDNLTIDTFDELAFEDKYSESYPSQYPFNEYGVYCSDLFSLNENDTVNILLRSSNQVCIENVSSDCEDGLIMFVFRRMDIRTIRSYAAQTISYEVDNFGSTWEVTVIFNAVETGSYQLSLFNKSGKSASFEYFIFQEE